MSQEENFESELIVVKIQAQEIIIHLKRVKNRAIIGLREVKC